MAARTRSSSFVSPLALVVMGALAGAAPLGACSEKLPPPLAGADAAPPPPPWGLETRPVPTTCTGVLSSAALAKISFDRVSPVMFQTPVGVVQQSGRLYVIQQGSTSGGTTREAMVRAISGDGSAAPTVIDVSSRVVAGGEAGLLGLAFHPKFAQNRFAFLYYTSPHPQQPPPAGVVFQSVVARYESNDGGLTLDPATEKRILVVDQPFANHNGGTIAFGNDGFLYFGLGDGGSGGDPMNVAQDKDKLLGKMLRIDVDSGDPYGIPSTNPFAAGGGRPEIYALGFRNPYRFSFDAPTGDLWVGDVGQSKLEEIDKVVLGGNYGWNVREGSLCYKPMTGCATSGLIDPVVDHGRNEAIAITGGVVYRGTKIPELTGKYVYADSSTGFFFAIATNEAVPKPLRLEQGLDNTHPVGFALDAAGEVVFADYTGVIWRIAAPKLPPEMPETLAATGCFDVKDPRIPSGGLFPYDVNVPQWMDGAVADRFMAIPAGAKLATKADGRFELPPGSVAIRTLRKNGKPTETQLLARRGTGAWASLAYTWNAEGTNAALSKTASATCLTCHNEAAGVTLGVEAAQLDHVFGYPDRPASVLRTLEHLGMLDMPPSLDSSSPLPALNGYETVERRARAYLHANCAFCHGGRAPTDMDLRLSQKLAGTRACDGRRLVPGNPAASSIAQRMRATDTSRMPPVGSSLPHDAAITVIEDFIRSTASCD